MLRSLRPLAVALSLVGASSALLFAPPLLAQSASPWTPGKAYKKGDVVSYSGATYTCLQPHTSQVGWEPTNTPALWQKGGSTPTVPGVPAGLSVAVVDSATLKVTWAAVTGASSYDLEVDGVAKTGVTRQTELMRLLLNGVAPLA